MQFHALSIKEVINEYQVDEKQGLALEQVEDNRKKFGENVLITRKPKPTWILFLEQFNNPFIYILIIAAILNAVVADLKDTIVIAACVTLNTLIGFIQELKASQALLSLKKLSSPIARVIRDGEQKTIPTNEVVCGDIIFLESGMRSPADARLIETQNLIVDESMLTGESFAVEKKADAIISKSAPLGDRITMVYSGTIIQKGRGTAVVTSVGGKTEFGQISEKVAEAEETVSPLQLQIVQLSKILTYTILTAVILIFVVGFLRGNHWLNMLLTCVGLAVSAIPEGLPVSVTITLTIGISLMAKHRAIVKKLAAVETLGSTNVICTDKTGTLTKNQMTVKKIWTAGEEFIVKGSGYTNEGDVILSSNNKKVTISDYKALQDVALNQTYCTESTITLNDNEWEITGDPTEGALMIASHKLNYKYNDSEVFVDIPFESENQYMAVRVNIDNKIIPLVKGAPEKLLPNCNSMIDLNGNEIPVETDTIRKIVANYSEQGLRVIALAKSKKCVKCNEKFTEKCKSCLMSIDDINNLVFIGLSAIQDAVREEAVDAVTECHNAGVRVVMITGDHAKTAQSVAHTVGIGNEAMALALGIGKKKDVPTVITGQELDEISDEELYNRVPDIDVYARVAPQHKFRIVKQLQARNNVVAMTGDGVNDAPALKQADIGVAMGSGTDVAKEASHIVLMDDNFATIVHAVRRGRIVLQNLQHILLYILATSLGGILTIAMSVALGLPLPVLPAQLLWINLVTDGTSTFPLAFEKEHGMVMAFPPRLKNSPLITNDIIKRMVIAGVVMMLGTLGVFTLSMHDAYNPTPEELARAHTLAFCTLALFQIWNVQNSRSVRRSLFFHLPYPDKRSNLDPVTVTQNPILLGVMLLAMALQVSAVLFPFMNSLLRTVPLNISDWAIVIFVPFSIIIIVEIMKYFEALYRKKNNIKM